MFWAVAALILILRVGVAETAAVSGDERQRCELLDSRPTCAAISLSRFGAPKLFCIRAGRYQGKLAPYFAIDSEMSQVASYFSGVTPASIGAVKRSKHAERRNTSGP